MNIYDIVKEALIKAHREDLIGYTPHCLIRPERPSTVKNVGKGKPNQHANTRTNEQNNKKNVQKKKTIRNVHKKSR